MTTELAGKTAPITGAGRGIGRAIAFGQADRPAPGYASGVVTPPGTPGGKNVAGGEANVSDSRSMRAVKGVVMILEADVIVAGLGVGGEFVAGRLAAGPD
jgi:NAD(P)-dependent dehydrogenase (short-subunit alcohol dehydrogenase family)